MKLLNLLALPGSFPFLTLAAPTSPELTFTLSSFTAYTTHNIPPNPNTPPLDPSTTYNTISFLARDETVLAICAAYTTSPLWTEQASYPCHIVHGDEDDEMWFSVGEGVGSVVVRKMWSWNGMYMTGTATQGTYWNGGKGGNMSVGAYGTWYERKEPWTFEVTSIVG